MANRIVPASVFTTSATPIGTPISPAIRNGASRGQSSARRILKTRLDWMISPPETTSMAACSGEIACSQIEVATMP